MHCTCCCQVVIRARMSDLLSLMFMLFLLAKYTLSCLLNTLMHLLNTLSCLLNTFIHLLKTLIAFANQNLLCFVINIKRHPIRWHLA